MHHQEHHLEHRQGHQAHQKQSMTQCASPTRSRCHMNSCMVFFAGQGRVTNALKHCMQGTQKVPFTMESMQIAPLAVPAWHKRWTLETRYTGPNIRR